MKYVGFFRGINVGGNKKVPMQDLKDLFASIGYTNVKTFLASGNILFDSSEKNLETISINITEHFEKIFGFDSHLILRTFESLKSLYDSNPFENIQEDKNTRKYITFLTNKPNADIKIPYKSPTSDFSILKVTEGEVVSVLHLNEKTRSVDSMKILEQKFGKEITTRNWNTIEKIVNSD